MTMTDVQRSAVIATLVKDFRGKNAFCGETHVQKSVYFMQDLFGVPLGFDYLLYIYGPTAQPDEAQEKRAQRILEVKPHIRVDEAMRAVSQIDRWRAPAR